MRNRMEHVIESYFGGIPQQIGSAISLVAWLVIAISSAVGGTAPERADMLSMHIRIFCSMFPLSFFAIVIGSRLKQQFSNPRARLTPNYVWPHLLVAAGLLCSVAFVSLIVGILNRGDVLTIVGVYGLALQLMAWGSSFSQSRIPTIIVAMVFVIWVPLLFFSETTLKLSNDFWKGKYPPLSAALVVMTIAGFYIYAKRIIALNEDDEHYSIPSTAEILSLVRSKKASPEYHSLVGRSVERSWYTKWAIDLIFKFTNLRYHDGQLWRHTMLYSINSWLRMPILFLLYPAMILGYICLLKFTLFGGLKIVMLANLCLLPVVSIIATERQQLLERRSYYMLEFLRPANRRELANVIACSTLVNVALQVGIQMLSMVLIVGVIEPKFLTVQILTNFVLLSLLCISFTTGTALWTSTLRKTWQYVVASSVLIFLLMIPAGFFIYAFNENSLTMISFGYAMTALLTGVIIFDAHRKWQSMEWA